MWAGDILLASFQHWSICWRRAYGGIGGDAEQVLAAFKLPAGAAVALGIISAPSAHWECAAQAVAEQAGAEATAINKPIGLAGKRE